MDWRCANVCCLALSREFVISIVVISKLESVVRIKCLYKVTLHPRFQPRLFLQPLVILKPAFSEGLLCERNIYGANFRLFKLIDLEIR